MMYHTTTVHRVTKYVLIQVIMAWSQSKKMAGVLLIRMVMYFAIAPTEGSNLVGGGKDPSTRRCAGFGVGGVRSQWKFPYYDMDGCQTQLQTSNEVKRLPGLCSSLCCIRGPGDVGTDMLG